MVHPVWKAAEKGVVMHGRRMNVTESCLDRHARETPERAALVFEYESGTRRVYSYAELLSEVCRFSGLLRSSGIRRGSRVFIFLPKAPELYIALLGAIRAGCIASPLFEAFQREGLVLRLESGRADAIVTNTELGARLPAAAGPLIPGLRKLFVVDSPGYRRLIRKQPASFDAVMVGRKESALMIFTSATAGTPVAGILIPHYALVQQHMTAKSVLGLTGSDHYWCTAHPGWVTGSVYGVLAPLSIGCTTHVYGGHFDAKRWLGFLRRHRISVLYTAPTALRLLRGSVARSDLEGLRNVCSVGEALTGAVFDFYRSLGVEINDTYWQTETGAIMIANTPGARKRHGSMGRAVPGITAAVKSGRIVFRPGWPSMMTAAYGHRKMYDSCFRSGWFWTNDMARLDRDGCFFFEGRSSDMIKTSGERVSPVEIESELMRHGAVQEAAVIGVPDRDRGESIKAFVVLHAGFGPSGRLKKELGLFVKQNYAGHSYPKDIVFVRSLPKTHSGKIIRAELRKMHS